MEEKSRSYGGFLTWEQDQEMYRRLKEMEESGMERRAVESARKWVSEHPEYYQKKIN